MQPDTGNGRSADAKSYRIAFHARCLRYIDIVKPNRMTADQMAAIEPDLKATMKQLKLNQFQMAVLLGVNYAAVSRWLAGNRQISEPIKRLLVLLENGKNTEAIAALDRYDPEGAALRDFKRKPGRPRKS